VKLPCGALRCRTARGSGGGPPEHIHFFTTEVTLHQTLRNWYLFIKNLLIVKYSLNVVPHTIIIFPGGLWKPLFRIMLVILWGTKHCG
jgi:hypothetical protein